MIAVRRVAVVLVVVLIAFVAWEWVTFPDVARLQKSEPETTRFMEIRKNELRRAGKDDNLDYRWVPYEKISPNLRRAVLVSEDSAFYDHKGVDVDGLEEALRRNWKERRFAMGGSTITQQLAKNLYLSPSKNPYRKLKEYLIARSLERNLSKKRILEIYLNVVEYGERVYGAEAAARHYFGKPASSLTPSEAALLAGALPNPRVMNPGDPNRRLRARQKIILSRMTRWGGVFEAEALRETARPPQEPPPLQPAPEEPEAPPPADQEFAPEPPGVPEEPVTEPPRDPPAEAPPEPDPEPPPPAP
jgi:monofunctional glycosyltransferase